MSGERERVHTVGDSRQGMRVLLLYRSFDPSVRLCAYLQLQWLADREKICFRHTSTVSLCREDLDWAQIVFFVRGDGLLDEKLASRSLAAGKRVVYVLDDDLLNVPRELMSGTFYAQRSVKRHILRLLSDCTCFCSSSSLLLEKYGGMCGRCFPVREPTSICLARKPEQPDGKVHIGFAGSPDRYGDVDRIISGALTEIKKRYGERVCIEFFGGKTALAETLHCRTYPFMESYEAYQEQMARLNWDIGLAPMPDTPFHACKYHNKLVEYSGFGIAGVYSDVLPYRGAVEHEYTGLLCENDTDSWVKALSRLIEDEQLRRRISDNCLKMARGAFSVETAARDMWSHLASLDVPEDMKPVGGLGLLKLKGMMSWYFEKFTKYGWKAPVVAVQKLVRLKKEDRG